MQFNENSVVFYNGKYVKAKDVRFSPYSQSFHYGNSAFEGIRAYETDDGTRIFKPIEHFKRLLYSCDKLHIKLNYTVEELTDISYELIRQNHLKNAYLRPLVFAGDNLSLTPSNSHNIFIGALSWAVYYGDKQTRLMTSSYSRISPSSFHVDTKVTGQYVNAILATREAKSKGFDEALLLDQNGFVSQCAASNFFFERDNVIYTPEVGNIFPGITRSTVIEIAKYLGYDVVEGKIRPEDLIDIDGAFSTGTAAEVAGIESIDGKGFRKKWEDTIGYEISVKYRKRVTLKEYKGYII
ncbi:branched-chain-amino-acid transaminase [Solitalea canadensis]|uniref:Branched-chain-amino-acid aminotransferase n=1 Tax=Solitalea canadensis (strain ATCC 29591 / DSM 3403 / JCM 21819 / LMG 8368 / NBRC 15130 / NCIMB 12057 / USAM 9D) TaxID=929556 RepID=H8KQS4_SOLCM|nr:branched-chain-amino-acid transaminase [Solitalea canadensis]AFD06945.1 branched-chain amino acid aminotransferase, group I [Solitalea canadensis DSM 3403]